MGEADSKRHWCDRRRLATPRLPANPDFFADADRVLVEIEGLFAAPAHDDPAVGTRNRPYYRVSSSMMPQILSTRGRCCPWLSFTLGAASFASCSAAVVVSFDSLSFSCIKPVS
jgi:hypothetical protein